MTIGAQEQPETELLKYRPIYGAWRLQGSQQMHIIEMQIAFDAARASGVLN